MREFSAFQQSYTKHNGEFELLAITNSKNGNPEGHVRDKGYSWQFGYSNEAPGLYRVGPIPHTLFIDREGNIKHSQVGALSHEQFEQHLSKIL